MPHGRSRHGKNPSDGERAVIKNAATRAVKNRTAIIQSAEDLYSFGMQHLERGQSGSCTPHYKRKFLYVDSDTVMKERQLRDKLRVLKGTRAIHTIRAGGKGKLQYRSASCFCGEEPCCNREYVDCWKQHSMRQTKSKHRDHDAGTGETEMDPSDLGGSHSLDLMSTSTLEYLESLNEIPDSVISSGNGNQVLAEVEVHAAEITDSENHGPVISSGNVNQVLAEVDVNAVEITASETPEPAATKGTVSAGSKSIFPGAWVAVSFPGKIKKIFLGTILEVDGQEASVKFCRQTGRYFTWPVVEDLSWMPVYCLTRLDAPTMDSRERLLLPDNTFNHFVK